MSTQKINPNNLYDVIIIGGGPAGLTAAIYLARAKYRVLVIEKEKQQGFMPCCFCYINAIFSILLQ